MLIVESVAENSIAAQIDIVVGDKVLSYNGCPLPSPSALLALEENTFGKESVTLRLAHVGEEIKLSTPLGKLGMETRLELPSELLTEYEAGREAFAATEYAEAVGRWREAAERAQDNGISAWLWGKAGEAWEKAGDWQEALDAWEAAHARLEGSEDTATQSHVLTALGRCCERLSEWDAATGWYQAAQQADASAGRELWIARANDNLGTIAFNRGDLVTAHDYYTRALEIEERLDPGSLQMASTLGNLGLVAWNRGDLAQHTTASVACWTSLIASLLDRYMWQ